MTLYDLAAFIIILYMYTVPDVPNGVSAETVNGSFERVIVKWEPPLNENGILLGYQVTYQGEEVCYLHDFFCLLVSYLTSSISCICRFLERFLY